MPEPESGCDAGAVEERDSVPPVMPEPKSGPAAESEPATSAEQPPPEPEVAQPGTSTYYKNETVIINFGVLDKSNSVKI